MNHHVVQVRRVLAIQYGVPPGRLVVGVQQVGQIHESGGLFRVVHVRQLQQYALAVGPQAEHAQAAGRGDHLVVEVILQAVDAIQRKVAEAAIAQYPQPVGLAGAGEVIPGVLGGHADALDGQVRRHDAPHLRLQFIHDPLGHRHVGQVDVQPLGQGMADAHPLAGVPPVGCREEHELQRALVDAPPLLVGIGQRLGDAQRPRAAVRKPLKQVDPLLLPRTFDLDAVQLQIHAHPLQCIAIPNYNRIIASLAGHCKGKTDMGGDEFMESVPAHVNLL